jgi:hypothetical protein
MLLYGSAIGNKSDNDSVLLTIVKRQAKYAIVCQIHSKIAYAVTD